MATLSLSIQSERTFLRQLHKYYDGLHNFTQQHFKTLINNIKSKNNNRQNIMNITVSIDGTWKRRGHVSNYGIVYIIDVQSGLCIDYEVMSLLCEVCNFKKSKLSPSQFTNWYKKHQLFCPKNYDGTSKSMEKEGTVRLFQRSIVNVLRYTHMLCDGDASAFEAIKHYYVKQSQQQQVHLKSDTSTSTKEQSDLKHGEIEDHDVEEEQEEEYDAGVEEEQEEEHDDVEEEQKYQSVDSSNNLIVIKEDCINHVSKRVMKYLLEMKRQKTRRVSFSKEVSTSKKQLSKQQLLDDNKRWGGGPGRMTNNMMKKLSNGYGLAVRQASALAAGKEVNEALDIMQQFTRAAFYHYLKTKDGNKEEQHQYCPKTSNTWCFYHQQKMLSSRNNTNIRKKNDRNFLDPIFRDILQPLIDKLTSKELLRRCLRGITQNSNESLNSIVW
ncbi:unnamed protein product [Rotaria sp. Silwood1]|nr:unnamed protein product [Rotaria sp. Silwood1]